MSRYQYSSSAFTLIEVTLYMAFLIMIGYSIFSFLGMTQQMLAQQAAFCESSVRDLIVLDLLKRDVMSAGPEHSQWDERAMIWCKETLNAYGNPLSVWVGWQLVEHGVSRTEGVYDCISHQWLKKKSNFFGCSLKSLTLQLKRDSAQTTRVVVLSYQQAQQDRKEEYICLRNSVLL